MRIRCDKNLISTFHFMKYLFLLLLFGCSNRHQVVSKLKVNDTVIKTVWQIQNGDTVSGYSIHIVNGDTVVQDFGVNPSFYTE